MPSSAFTLFYGGLRFIGRFPGLGGLLVERLLFLLFACLFGLLLNLQPDLVSYTNLFRNRETALPPDAPGAAAGGVPVEAHGIHG
jgi:hypothetical protein